MYGIADLYFFALKRYFITFNRCLRLAISTENFSTENFLRRIKKQRRLNVEFFAMLCTDVIYDLLFFVEFVFNFICVALEWLFSFLQILRRISHHRFALGNGVSSVFFCTCVSIYSLSLLILLKHS